jgi:hypothetical protein
MYRAPSFQGRRDPDEHPPMAPLSNEPPRRPRREPIGRPNLPGAAVDVFCFHENNGIESNFILSAAMC